MDKVLFKSNYVEITATGSGLHLIVFDNLIANRMNKVLNNYYDGTVVEGEEPIFKITIDEGVKLCKSCFKGDTGAYIERIIKKHQNDLLGGT